MDFDDFLSSTKTGKRENGSEALTLRPLKWLRQGPAKNPKSEPLGKKKSTNGMNDCMYTPRTTQGEWKPKSFSDCGRYVWGTFFARF